MKLLIVVASKNEIAPFFELYNGSRFIQNPLLPFLFSGKILQHEVDVLETGYGIFQTSYKLAKVLTQQKYHLALKLSLCNSYKAEVAVGNVLNIINEKPGDYGMSDGNEWKDLYDLQLLNTADVPHVRNGFINMTNSYMNVFMPFKKAVGVTVNNYADTNIFGIRKEKYKADCETGDGLGFAYTCLFEKQTFYHIAFVERNLQSGEFSHTAAISIMNEVLIDLIQKL
jgi:hypothetical protein